MDCTYHRLGDIQYRHARQVVVLTCLCLAWMTPPWMKFTMWHNHQGSPTLPPLPPPSSRRGPSPPFFPFSRHVLWTFCSALSTGRSSRAPSLHRWKARNQSFPTRLLEPISASGKPFYRSLMASWCFGARSAGASAASSGDLGTASTAVGAQYAIPQNIWPRDETDMPTLGRVEDVVQLSTNPNVKSKSQWGFHQSTNPYHPHITWRARGWDTSRIPGSRPRVPSREEIFLPVAGPGGKSNGGAPGASVWIPSRHSHHILQHAALGMSSCPHSPFQLQLISSSSST